jgi:glycosyltransferase involved in cell wall biosynthesis
MVDGSPFISVVICTYKRDILLTEALQSFTSLEACEVAEIIVVDNDPNGQTETIVESCRLQLRDVIAVSYVIEPVLGVSRARNTGARNARGAVVAFLDDDFRPGPLWLKAINDLFQKESAAVVAGGPIKPRFGCPPPSWLVPRLQGYFGILNLGDREIEFPEGRLPFGNFAIRADELKRHWFREDLGKIGDLLICNEETSMLKRVRARNRKITYLPDMQVSHYIPSDRLTVEWVKRRARFQGISEALEATDPHRVLGVLCIALARAALNSLRALWSWRRYRLVAVCRIEEVAGVFDVLLKKFKSPNSQSKVDQPINSC